MNWLAHTLLADRTAESRLGHVLADVVPVRARGTLSPAIRAAIAEHVEVDRFTDRHEAVRASAARIAAPYRRFAGVLVDVFYGHCLVRVWPHHSAVALDVFTADVYASMLGYDGPLPEGVRPMLTRLAAEDWLGAYRSVEGMAGLLARMARRLSVRFARDVELAGAVAQFTAHEAAFTAEFDAFFPDLLAHARSFAR